MTAERTFVDTNIWFYAFVCGESEDDQRKNKIAQHLIKSRRELSIQVVNELSVNLIRKAKYNEPDLQKLIESFFHHHRVHALTRQTLICASTIRSRYAISFWDSLIASTALENSCSTLYSEDMQNGLVIDYSLTVINPFT